MAIDGMPTGLIPSGNSPIFTEVTIPGALQREHKLAASNWGVLSVIEGSVRFVDLETADERVVSAPNNVTIRPQAPHRLIIDGPVRCQIEFFREPERAEPLED